jgi:AraC-like DNA-binding protein
VDGILEVFHAAFTEHAYPIHTHNAWTLLLVDEGAVKYGLDHREHGAGRSSVTLLPPHVLHDGQSAVPGGFRKRVLYLDRSLLDDGLIGASVDTPALRDPVLRARVDQLHNALIHQGDDLEAASRLVLIRERLGQHLRRHVVAPPDRRDAKVATRFRDLLDARTPDGIRLDEAAGLLGVHPAHLVRAFSREFGMPPHQYLTGRRVELARRLLLGGHRPAEVAALAGFYDQSHLTRNFRRMVGTSPARFQRR